MSQTSRLTAMADRMKRSVRNCAPIIIPHNFSLPSPFPHLRCLIEAVFEFFRKD